MQLAYQERRIFLTGSGTAYLNFCRLPNFSVMPRYGHVSVRVCPQWMTWPSTTYNDLNLTVTWCQHNPQVPDMDLTPHMHAMYDINRLQYGGKWKEMSEVLSCGQSNSASHQGMESANHHLERVPTLLVIPYALVDLQLHCKSMVVIVSCEPNQGRVWWI